MTKIGLLKEKNLHQLVCQPVCYQEECSRRNAMMKRYYIAKTTVSSRVLMASSICTRHSFYTDLVAKKLKYGVCYEANVLCDVLVR